MLRTDDLFLAALGLVRGGELHGTEIRGTNGRRVAVFLIAGTACRPWKHDYYGGASLVNLRLFKSEVIICSPHYSPFTFLR